MGFLLDVQISQCDRYSLKIASCLSSSDRTVNFSDLR